MKLLFAGPPVAGRSPKKWGESRSAASSASQKPRRLGRGLRDHGGGASEAGLVGRR